MHVYAEMWLSYVMQRWGPWDAVACWGDTLSLGEQQRIGLVSCWFHASALDSLCALHSGCCCILGYALMKTVRLSYLTQREGSWNALASWG